jgi:hypothetical protein
MRHRESHIIAKIEKAAKAHKLAPSTICERAVRNTRLYSRLKNNGSVSADVADRLLEYLEGLEGAP